MIPETFKGIPIDLISMLAHLRMHLETQARLMENASARGIFKVAKETGYRDEAHWLKLGSFGHKQQAEAIGELLHKYGITYSIDHNGVVYPEEHKDPYCPPQYIAVFSTCGPNQVPDPAREALLEKRGDTSLAPNGP